MATFRQIEANRLNALKSTGPVSSEGKAVSRFNALKTGIHAQSQVIPGEDPAELEALAAGYHCQFPAATPLERFLVDTLIQAEWQLRRLHRLEAQLWTNQIHDTEGDAQLGQAYARALDVFTRLQRRIDATERSYYRALRELQRLRSAEPEPAAWSEPAPGPCPPAPETAPNLASFRDAPDDTPPPAA